MAHDVLLFQPDGIKTLTKHNASGHPFVALAFGFGDERHGA